MIDQVYQRGLYSEIDQTDIRQRVMDEGWIPYVIDEPPGYAYAPHRHEEAKLIVILRGEMDVTLESETIHCRPGDKLTIPGGMEHAAVMGAEGCAYFWSEQVRG
jgi:mannose-6-phosphate isomerase-like protein (cupin superfamily)